MTLIIGGAFQGKLNYALENFDIQKNDVSDMEFVSIEKIDEIFEKKCINSFHLLIRKLIYEKDIDKDIENIILNKLQKSKVEIIISNEVGNGIIPMEEKELLFREATGHTLCKIAELSNKVIKIDLGIAREIK